MLKKLIFISFLAFNISIIYAEENKVIDFSHRIFIGSYTSYWNDNIGILETGYDFIVNFPYITLEYNILDFGIGLSGLLAFDGIGNPRKPVAGLGINGSMRLYSPYIRTVRLYIDGIMSLVIYSEEYPKNGTIVNGGWHLGGGIEIKTENGVKLFSKILWFHTSNNDVYGRDRNPSINAIGIMAGIQLWA